MVADGLERSDGWLSTRAWLQDSDLHVVQRCWVIAEINFSVSSEYRIAYAVFVLKYGHTQVQMEERELKLSIRC